MIAVSTVGLAVGAYVAYVGITWCRYGRVRYARRQEEQDVLLDRFMPTYDVVERRRARVAAPAEITFAAARELDLFHLPVVRAIIRIREVILGAIPDRQPRPRGLLAEVLSLGWGVLAEVPGREIVVGSVTKPWEANPVFRALPPDEFATFREAGYVKIAWTLRADPVGEAESTFRTETRVITTDPASRARFRWYWSLLSPGIILIRRISVGPLRRDAERRAREGRSRIPAVECRNGAAR